MSSAVDRVFDRLFGVRELAPDDDDVVFRVAIHPHRGDTLSLADGTRVPRGAPVAELHLRTARLERLHTSHDTPYRVGLEFHRLARRSFGVLAEAWRSDPRFQGVEAAYGAYLFPGLSGRYGFELHPITPPWRRALLSWWIRRIVAKAHPDGERRVRGRHGLHEVAEIWISKRVCEERFRDPAAHRAGARAAGG